MSNQNVLLLSQLALQYLSKLQEISRLFNTAAAEGRDVTKEEVDASSVSRDAALAQDQAALDAANP